MKLLLLIALPFCIWLLIVGILNQVAPLIVIAAIPLTALVISMGFFLNYGIRITSKRVTLMNQHMLKVFRYEDVIYIKIIFDNENIFGEIKAKKQKTYEFCFDGVDLSSGTSFLMLYWIAGLKITRKFVDKSISDLSACEKVKIQNLYAEQEK